MASSAEQAILDLIGQVESSGNYDAYHTNSRSTTDLSKLTIAEIQKYQKELGDNTGSSALGRYGFTEKTLADLIRSEKLKPTDKFSRALQDKLAVALLKRRGYDDYAAGKLSEDEFINNLAKEWAGLPVASGTGTGKSYWEGKTGEVKNKAGATVAQTRSVLQGALATPSARGSGVRYGTEDAPTPRQRPSDRIETFLKVPSTRQRRALAGRWGELVGRAAYRPPTEGPYTPPTNPPRDNPNRPDDPDDTPTSRTPETDTPLVPPVPHPRPPPFTPLPYPMPQPHPYPTWRDEPPLVPPVPHPRLPEDTKLPYEMPQPLPRLPEDTRLPYEMPQPHPRPLTPSGEPPSRTMNDDSYVQTPDGRSVNQGRIIPDSGWQGGTPTLPAGVTMTEGPPPAGYTYTSSGRTDRDGENPSRQSVGAGVATGQPWAPVLPWAPPPTPMPYSNSVSGVGGAGAGGFSQTAKPAPKTSDPNFMEWLLGLSGTPYTPYASPNAKPLLMPSVTPSLPASQFSTQDRLPPQSGLPFTGTDPIMPSWGGTPPTPTYNGLPVGPDGKIALSTPLVTPPAASGIGTSTLSPPTKVQTVPIDPATGLPKPAAPTFSFAGAAAPVSSPIPTAPAAGVSVPKPAGMPAAPAAGVTPPAAAPIPPMPSWGGTPPPTAAPAPTVPQSAWVPSTAGADSYAGMGLPAAPAPKPAPVAAPTTAYDAWVTSSAPMAAPVTAPAAAKVGGAAAKPAKAGKSYSSSSDTYVPTQSVSTASKSAGGAASSAPKSSTPSKAVSTVSKAASGAAPKTTGSVSNASKSASSAAPKPTTYYNSGRY